MHWLRSRRRWRRWRWRWPWWLVLAAAGCAHITVTDPDRAVLLAASNARLWALEHHFTVNSMVCRPHAVGVHTCTLFDHRTHEHVKLYCVAGDDCRPMLGT